MARRARKALADLRAMEEEGERQNEISEVRGGALSRVVGGRTRRTKKSEAYEGGALLSRHLKELHGAGWWDDFKSGFNSVVAPIAGVAKSVLPFAGPLGSLASAGIGALGYGHGGEESESDEECAGGSRTGRYEGQGKLVITHGGKKRRSNKRAEVVKRVMREKGLSMIEASKYVKAHGLY